MPETAEPADTVTASASGTGGGPVDPLPADADAATPERAHRAERPNRSAWLMVLPWAAVAIVGVAVYEVARHPDRAVLPSIAIAVVPAVVVAAICAWVASRSSSAWSWWLYPPIVVIPAVALVVLADVMPDRLENVPDDGDRGNRSLVAPERAGEWTLQHGPGSDEQEAELRERTGRADESLEAVYGDYRRGGDDMLVYNGIKVTNDSDLARELIGRPEATLDGYLEATGITDVEPVEAGDLRGAMACGTYPRLGPYVDLIVCGWADSGGIGTAIYRVDGINRESAAETTREFRAAVTVLG